MVHFSSCGNAKCVVMVKMNFEISLILKALSLCWRFESRQVEQHCAVTGLGSDLENFCNKLFWCQLEKLTVQASGPCCSTENKLKKLPAKAVLWSQNLDFWMSAFSCLLSTLENICLTDLLRMNDLVLFPNDLCLFLKFSIFKLLLSVKLELVHTCGYHYLLSRRCWLYLFRKRLASWRFPKAMVML